MKVRAWCGSALCCVLWLHAGRSLAAAPVAREVAQAPQEAPSVRLRERLGSAETLEPGELALAAFDTSRLGLASGLELGAQALGWLLLGPNLELRQRIFQQANVFAASFEVGAWVPTGTARLFQGYLFPTNEVSGEGPGWAVIAAGRLHTTVFFRQRGAEQEAVGLHPLWLTSSLGVSLRLRLSGPTPASLDTIAPLELALAPYTTGFRASAAVTQRFRITRRLRLDLTALADRTGARAEGTLSPIFLGGRLLGHWDLTECLTSTLGIVGYNYDQGRTRVSTDALGWSHRERVRQTDLYPSFDLTWLF
jgi:hypothetical protein